MQWENITVLSLRSRKGTRQFATAFSQKLKEKYTGDPWSESPMFWFIFKITKRVVVSEPWCWGKVAHPYMYLWDTKLNNNNLNSSTAHIQIRAAGQCLMLNAHLFMETNVMKGSSSTSELLSIYCSAIMFSSIEHHQLHRVLFQARYLPFTGEQCTSMQGYELTCKQMGPHKNHK